MFSHKKFNSSYSISTWRNVGLPIALITFILGRKRKDPKISFKCFQFASRYTVISPQRWQLTLHLREQRHNVCLNMDWSEKNSM